MAATEISNLSALGAAPATNDLLVLVDVSDLSMAASGTTKKMTVQNLIDAVGAPSGAGTVNRITKWTGATALGDSIYEDTGSALQPIASGKNLGGAGVTNQWQHLFLAGNSFVEDNHTISVGGSNVAYFRSSGRLGIRESNPLSVFEVKGVASGSGQTFLLKNGSSTTTAVMLDNGSFGINKTLPTVKLHVGRTGVTEGDNIVMADGSYFGNFTINTYGCVGIGKDVSGLGGYPLYVGATGNKAINVSQAGVAWLELRAVGNNDAYIFMYAENGARISHAFQDSGAKSFINNDGAGLVVGSETGSASAILEAISTTKGIRFPNMTTAQKNAIAAPEAGLVVYDTTLNKLCVYTTAWETITSV